MGDFLARSSNLKFLLVQIDELDVFLSIPMHFSSDDVDEIIVVEIKRACLVRQANNVNVCRLPSVQDIYLKERLFSGTLIHDTFSNNEAEESGENSSSFVTYPELGEGSYILTT